MIKMSFITNWIFIDFLFKNTGGIDFHIEKLLIWNQKVSERKCFSHLCFINKKTEGQRVKYFLFSGITWYLTFVTLLLTIGCIKN